MLADENELVTKVLTGSTTAYSHRVDEPVLSTPYATGCDLILVAALQVSTGPSRRPSPPSVPPLPIQDSRRTSPEGRAE